MKLQRCHKIPYINTNTHYQCTVLYENNCQSDYYSDEICACVYISIGASFYMQHISNYYNT